MSNTLDAKAPKLTLSDPTHDGRSATVRATTDLPGTVWCLVKLSSEPAPSAKEVVASQTTGKVAGGAASSFSCTHEFTQTSLHKFYFVARSDKSGVFSKVVGKEVRPPPP